MEPFRFTPASERPKRLGNENEEDAKSNNPSKGRYQEDQVRGFTPPFAPSRRRPMRYFFIVAFIILALVSGIAWLFAAASKPPADSFKKSVDLQIGEGEISLFTHAHLRAIARNDGRALLTLYKDNATLTLAEGAGETSWSGIEQIRTAWLGAPRKKGAPAQAGLLSSLNGIFATSNPSIQDIQKDDKGGYSVKVVVESAEGPLAEVVDEFRFSQGGLIQQEKLTLTRREIQPTPEPTIHNQ